MSKVTIDPNQVDLTEEQNEALAKEALEELEAEQKGEVIPEEAEEEKPKEEEPEEEEKPEEKEEEPKKEDEESPEEPSEEESEPSEDNKDEEASEEKPELTDEEIKAEVRQIAIDEGMTMKEAEDQFSKRQSLIEKYKSDPKAMAKALQSTQSAYDKLKSKQDQSDKSVQEKQSILDSQQASAQINAYVEKNRDALLDKYKAKYPHKSESLSDEAIIEDLVDTMNNKYSVWAEGERSKIKDEANKLRDELVDGLSEADREFLPEIKKVIQETSDDQIISEQFNIKDVIYWAKGQRYDDDIKAAEERGKKMASEEAKILGEKVPSANDSTKTVKTESKVTLNEEQKERALNMFEGQKEMSDEDKFEAFADIYKDELKKKDSVALQTT